MKKKILGLVLCTLMVISLIGCGKTNEGGNDIGSSAENNRAVVELPTEYNQTSDTITFNTAVNFPEEILNSGMKVITASPQEINSDKAFEVLMGNTEIRDYGEVGGELWYEGEDDSVLTIDPYNLAYGTRFSTYVCSAFRLQQGYSDYNAYKYSTDNEFNFATQEQAFEAVKSALLSMGIDIGDQYVCYALDHTIMQEEEYLMDINGQEATAQYKDQWTEDDDSYYFIINQSFDDIPSYHVYYEAFPMVAEENAPVQVIYNKDGIQFLNIERVFSFTEGNGVYELKNFSDIAQVIQNKYGMILGSSTYEVTSATLYYMENKIADNQYEVLPVWIINTVDNLTGKILQDVVNAQTAEEIIWEEK